MRRGSYYISSTRRGGGWSPDNPEGTARLWLDGADSDSMTLDGSNVTEWRSKVGTWTYSQATGALQPALSTVNGVQSVLASYGQFLAKEEDAVVVDNDEAFLFAAVIKAESASILQGVWCDGSGSKEIVMLDLGNDANWGRASWVTAAGRFYTLRFDSGNTMATTPEFFSFEYDGVNNDAAGWTAEINESSVDVVNGTPHASFGGYGRLFDNTLGYYYPGHICEIIVIADPTATDKSEVASYLTAKWGL